MSNLTRESLSVCSIACLASFLPLFFSSFLPFSFLSSSLPSLLPTSLPLSLPPFLLCFFLSVLPSLSFSLLAFLSCSSSPYFLLPSPYLSSTERVTHWYPLWLLRRSASQQFCWLIIYDSSLPHPHQCWPLTSRCAKSFPLGYIMTVISKITNHNLRSSIVYLGLLRL